MKRIVRIGAILLLAIIIGFVQERLKVNVNYILETGDKLNGFFLQTPDVKAAWLEQVKVDAPYDYYYNHDRMDFLLTFSRKELVITKWVITVVFVLIFLCLNALLIHWITGERSLVKWTVYIYVIFFALSFAVYILGVTTSTTAQAYGISRKIVGGLQSLVPLMILFPGYWMHRSYFSIKKL